MDAKINNIFGIRIAIGAIFLSLLYITSFVFSTYDYQWAIKGGGLTNDYAIGVTVDSSGNSYIAGYFFGSTTFGSTTLVSSGLEDTFIAKLSSTGVYLRASKGGGTTNDGCRGIVVDTAGNAYIAGYFQSRSSFGSILLTGLGGYDTFTAKLSSTGVYLRAVKGGGTSNDYIYGVAVDGLGNSYVGGHFQGTATFGSTTLVSSGGYDAFIAKLSSTGVYLRASKGGGTGSDYAYGVAIDGLGNSYVGGHFQLTATFGSTTLVSSGGYDVFITKLSSTGEYLWTMKGGSSNPEYAYGVAVDVLGNSYLAGYFGGSAVFGSILLTGNGSWDTFITKVGSFDINIFTINSGAIFTNTANIFLNISTTPEATHMRFSDDGSSRSARETYATTKSWTLPGTYGSKSVYAQFDANNDQVSDVETNDSINYTDGSLGGACVGGVGEACLSLEITAVTGECRYGINLDLGDHAQTYNAFTMTGGFLSNHTSTTRWSCNDTAGKSPWNMQISSTDLVVTGTSYSIPNTTIEIKTAELTKYRGSNSYTGSIGAFASRGTNLSTPRKIFEKTSPAGTVGEIGTDTVDLRVLVPINQEIGAYQATITIAYPQI